MIELQLNGTTNTVLRSSAIFISYFLWLCSPVVRFNIATTRYYTFRECIDLVTLNPATVVRRYITQLMSSKLTKADQRSMDVILRSALDGTAYWVGALTQESDTGKIVIEDSKSRLSNMLELSPIDQPGIRVTTDYTYLTKVKEADIPVLLENDISVYYLPDSKVLYYLSKLGCLCVLSYWLFEAYVIVHGFMSLGCIPECRDAIDLMRPALFIPFFYNNSIYKGPVFITLKTGDDPCLSKSSVKPDEEFMFNEIRSKEHPGVDVPNPKKVLTWYRIQRFLGSFLYMIPFYLAYFGLSSLAKWQQTTRLGVFYWYCLLAEPVLYCILCYIASDEEIIRRWRASMMLSLGYLLLKLMHNYSFCMTWSWWIGDKHNEKMD
ncbi:hypothetical protein K493DRAFT_307494 [Basidiobolus meristosporus CBS 931.73]|uniref:Uncharacterized protein n=1 Tax=Basidiobolus meristosporus CBS 931.73 TaxID=1314790 RepID=A0A1Y1XED8_9FUNG|nr:hypothetical protein K493DRAFT_307494 [Basidiobolus meristosporus CBS 931.73]|eukprot:ORX84052.1 hypothetical protein K493DRAFT_307494 [Basidiobolus meristosporus CBS 931.73]